ncbi:coproporphyrinogen III oxidase [Aliishimia ponticola]|uniref:Heme chaperone HemW n=1 Tax=Aliishimia ponticola TaxID=2499833 RepID=A0A4S4N6G8_9RHOB|nr:radical SAM family heme chaperone HemW [Aliishimia ponticola]THH34649.1 coproporphyrinogen III oxidase [Aliishimia ponticola]
MLENWQNGGFSIYLHWPFCEAKCPYCDFNSYVSASIDQDAWKSAYLREIDRYADELPGRVVQSIFFGGGTPSLMEPSTVQAVIDRVATRFSVANDIEITLEANPSSVEASRFSDYRTAGVNRVSLGVQALNDPDLKRLGRLHSAAEAVRAMEIAQNAFDRASFDLIYARQNQSVSDWTAELKQALTMGFSHLSLYQLTIESGTAFGDRYKRGKLGGLPSEDDSADMYDVTVEMCKAAGIPMYEVSNFAAPGEQSNHNLIYWRYGDYVGIGPGAHGRFSHPERTRTATETPLSPAKWLQAALAGRDQETRQLLSAEEQGVEFLLMGLRLREGVSLDRFTELAGQDLSPNILAELESEGVIIRRDDQIIVSDQYVKLLNAVLERLIED